MINQISYANRFQGFLRLMRVEDYFTFTRLVIGYILAGGDNWVNQQVKQCSFCVQSEQVPIHKHGIFRGASINSKNAGKTGITNRPSRQVASKKPMLTLRPHLLPESFFIYQGRPQ